MEPIYDQYCDCRNNNLYVYPGYGSVCYSYFNFGYHNNSTCHPDF